MERAPLLQAFTFWTGIYNAVLTLIMLTPSAQQAIGLYVCDVAWQQLLAGFLGYTAVVLIYASRDLSSRAPLLYWEALLRFAAALVVIPAGMWGNIGVAGAALGVGDTAIGIVYIYGLTVGMGFSHANLLSLH